MIPTEVANCERTENQVINVISNLDPVGSTKGKHKLIVKFPSVNLKIRAMHVLKK